jgi:putative addiction module component (TIGR02574 family)
MTQPVNIADILALSITERILLVQEIWDSIAAEQEGIPLTESQRNEMDRRNGLYEASPEVGSSLDEVRARLEVPRPINRMK